MATKPEKPIAFIDLVTQRQRIGNSINEKLAKIMDTGAFIFGPDLHEMEKTLADYSGVKHCLSCASGTDALVLPLMAWGVGPGDAVFVPSFTFVATAEAAVLLGATPVFVDSREDTFNMDVEDLKRAIAYVKKETDLKPKVVIPVDIFGQPADYDAIIPVARAEGMKVLADSAQSYGATWNGKKVGSIGDMTATSFFPAKPLGCYGDGGAVFCNSDEEFELLKSLRVHGMSKEDKYDNIHIGMNGRMDTMQCAVILEKMKFFDDELPARNRIAKRYRDNLPMLTHQVIDDRAYSVWAQYVMVVKNRAEIMKKMSEKGVPAAAYYPKPVHMQTAYQKWSTRSLPVCEALAANVMSPPMHPYIEEDVQDYIIETIIEAVK